jgi:hypothetical protein
MQVGMMRSLLLLLLALTSAAAKKGEPDPSECEGERYRCCGACVAKRAPSRARERARAAASQPPRLVAMG